RPVEGPQGVQGGEPQALAHHGLAAPRYPGREGPPAHAEERLMRHNGERRPEEIEAEIARTRTDMDATLTAIEQRLTPGQLIDQGLDYMRHSGGREFVSNLGGSVKNNPIPVALMGIGMAWLMATGNRRPAYLRESAESGGP